MPPPPARRRPAGGPVRRPRVAGLRRPTTEHPERAPVPTPPPAPEPARELIPEPVPEPERDVVLDAPLGVDPEPVHPERTEPEPLDEDVRVVVEPDPPARARAGFGTAIAVAVLALLLAVLALWLKGESDALTAGANAANRALVDPAATSEVSGKVSVAVERVLSYNYADLAANAAAVRETLTGRAVCEYDQLFGQVRKLAPAQKLVLTTRVRQLGVRWLEGDRADLLVFVDQSTTRADRGETAASGAQFGVRAERVGGTWKIAEFDMLNQPLPGGRPAGGCS